MFNFKANLAVNKRVDNIRNYTTMGGQGGMTLNATYIPGSYVLGGGGGGSGWYEWGHINSESVKRWYYDTSKCIISGTLTSPTAVSVDSPTTGANLFNGHTSKLPSTSSTFWNYIKLGCGADGLGLLNFITDGYEYWGGGGGGGIPSNAADKGAVITNKTRNLCYRGGKGGGGEGGWYNTSAVSWSTTFNATDFTNVSANSPMHGRDGYGGGGGGNGDGSVSRANGGSGCIIIRTTNSSIITLPTPSTYTDPQGTTWKYVKVTTTGNTTFTLGSDPSGVSFDILIVGGGGCGGSDAGGGGGGGKVIYLKNNTNDVFTSMGSYTLVVGVGGTNWGNKWANNDHTLAMTYYNNGTGGSSYIKNLLGNTISNTRAYGGSAGMGLGGTTYTSAVPTYVNQTTIPSELTSKLPSGDTTVHFGGLGGTNWHYQIGSLTLFNTSP